MILRRFVVLFVLLCAAMPARAEMHLAPTAAAAVAGSADMQAVIVVKEGIAKASVSHDAAGFMNGLAPEFIVNSPANRVLTRSQVEKAFGLGLIDYGAVEQRIEFIAARPDGEILLMGAETVTPRGKTHNAGSTETYRVTELWQKIGGAWKTAVRQATISAVQ